MLSPIFSIPCFVKPRLEFMIHRDQLLCAYKTWLALPDLSKKIMIPLNTQVLRTAPIFITNSLNLLQREGVVILIETFLILCWYSNSRENSPNMIIGKTIQSPNKQPLRIQMFFKDSYSTRCTVNVKIQLSFQQSHQIVLEVPN